MEKATFNYMFADDPNTTMPELLARHRQQVTIVRELDQSEYDYEGDEMFLVRFPDGFATTVFGFELEA